MQISFSDWIKNVARARGEVAALVKEAKTGKFPAINTLKDLNKKRPGNEAAWARYEQFVKRGSQSKGKRPVKIADAAVAKKAA